jgi:DnaJ-class molecular chaperone
MFFVEQILLGPQSDSYRTLGGDRATSSADLRRNMALLLRSLHPDLEPESGGAAAAWRVARAWNDVKTPQRRAAYDATLPSVVVSAPAPSKGRRRRRRRTARVEMRRGSLLRALLSLFGRGGAAGGA